MDGGTARALSRQQPAVGTRSATGWSQRLRGPCCVLPWCRAAVPRPTPSRHRPADVGRRGGPRRWPPAWLLALAFPTHDRYGWRPSASPCLAAAACGASWRLAAGLGLTGRSGLLRADAVVVRGLRRRPALARPGVLEALYIAAMSAVTAAVQRPLLATGCGRWRMPPCPSVWVAAGGARGCHTPFGGFPWARLAFSQADSPLAHLAALAGAPGVTFGGGVAGRCCSLPAAVLARRAGRGAARRDSPGAAALACGAAWRSPPCRRWPSPLVTTADRRSPVAGRCSSRATCPGRAWSSTPSAAPVLDNHVAGDPARPPARRRAGRPDLVVWPENSSDIDPLRNPDAAAAIDSAAADGRGAVLVGAVLARAARRTISNVSLFYRPGRRGAGALRQAAPGAVRRVHPVPVLLPRSSATMVDLVRPTSSPGTRPGVFRVPARRRRLRRASRRSASRWPTTT